MFYTQSVLNCETDKMCLDRRIKLILVIISLGCVNEGDSRLHQNSEAQSIPIVIPVSQLEEGRLVPMTQTFISNYPHWVNLTLLEIGQSFMRDNIFGLSYAVGLGGAVAVNPDITRILLTISNTTHLRTATERYLSNTLHFKYWSSVDLVRDQDKLFESLNLVHAMHGKVGYRALENPHIFGRVVIPEPQPHQNPYNVNLKVWDAFEKDLRNSKLASFEHKAIMAPTTFKLHNDTANATLYHHMNQFTFACFVWFFTHAPIAIPEKSFIYDATEEELMGFLHLWAFMGHAVGVEDKYNICLQPNLKTAQAYFNEFFKTYFLPELFHLDYEYKVVVEVVMQSVTKVYPFPADLGILLLRVCEDVLEIKCPYVERSLNPQGRLVSFLLRHIVPQIMRLNSVKGTVRSILNRLLHVSTLKHFHFNTFDYDNFTAGIIELGEETLARTFNINYNMENEYECNHHS